MCGDSFLNLKGMNLVNRNILVVYSKHTVLQTKKQINDAFLCDICHLVTWVMIFGNDREYYSLKKLHPIPNVAVNLMWCYHDPNNSEY